MAVTVKPEGIDIAIQTNPTGDANAREFLEGIDHYGGTIEIPRPTVRTRIDRRSLRENTQFSGPGTPQADSRKAAKGEVRE